MPNVKKFYLEFNEYYYYFNLWTFFGGIRFLS